MAGTDMLSLPVADWPGVDREAWEAATTDGGYFAATGAAAAWKPKTVRQVVKDWGMYLRFLQDRGHLIAANRTGDRLAAEWLFDYADHLQRARNLADQTVLRAIRNLRAFVRVTDPAAELALVARLYRHLARGAGTRRHKPLRVVSPMALLQAGIAEMQDAMKTTRGSWHLRAGWYRNGLQVAMLALRPIRLANFATLEIGCDLVLRTDGWWLSLCGEETKNGDALAVPLPAEVQPWLQHYLDEIRPALLGESATPRLWVSNRRRPMTEQAIYCRVVAFTTRRLGAPVNPHLFRDCLATCVGEVAPEEVRACARILGHRSLRTIERHYNHARGQVAQRRYHEIIQTIRAGAD